MARNKKTRKQKMTADVRRIQHTIEPSYSYQGEKMQQSSNEPKERPVMQTKTSSGIISTADYHYLVQDLRKILFVTAAILAVQLILRFFVFQ